jgi:hypothetical protein
MHDNELHGKVDEILIILKDPNVGICKEVKQLKEVVYGNGKRGLAEQVRFIDAKMAMIGLSAAILVEFAWNYFLHAK